MSSESDSNDEPGLFDDLPLQEEPSSTTTPKTPEPRPEKTRPAESETDLADPSSPESLKQEAAALFEDLEPPKKKPESKLPVAAKQTSSVSAKPPSVESAAPKTPVRKPRIQTTTKVNKPKASAAAVTRPVWKPTVALSARIRAGAIDLIVNLAVFAGVWFGLRQLRVDLGSDSVIPLAVFLLSFSFLYFVFPLAFWGRTPGMAQAEITARSRDGRSLSFSQSALRWLGALLTLATLCIPLIFAAKSGELPSDRLSGSLTYPAK